MINETQNNQPKVNKRKNETFSCEICSIEVGSLDVLECHKKGQKHAKKLRRLAETQSIQQEIKPVNEQPVNIVDSTIPSTTNTQSKNSLQLLFEFSTKNKIKLTYETVSESGPSHNKQFQVKCKLNNLTNDELIKETTAIGSSINRAKHSAADIMLKEMTSLEEYVSVYCKKVNNNKSTRKTSNKPNNTSDVEISGIRFLNEYEELISTNNKRCILAKNCQIQPDEQQLNFLSSLLCQIEASLKTISDKLLEEEITRLESKPENVEAYRQLESVVRVDNLAKETFLKIDRNLSLVILIKSLPTFTLVKRIYNELNLFLVSTDLIKFNLINENECLSIRCESIDTLTDVYLVKLYFTSMLITSNTLLDEQIDDTLPPDVSRHALTLVMRLKWFNTKLKPITNSVLIIRLIRDLCHRSPTWSVLNDWLIELLIDKCFFRFKYEEIGSKLRAFFELVSSGCLFLKDLSIRIDSSNLDDDIICLIDPCTNKDAFDQVLTQQQIEDLTSSAQHALRLISFNCVHQVLAIDLQS